MDQLIVQTFSLTKRYGNVPALNACSIDVNRGEVFGLLGPNGSGKTTLLRLLMGFLRPTSGTSRINGFDCYQHSLAVHSTLSYLPGEPRLFRQMRGRQVLEFFANVRPDGDLQRSLELADRLKLDLNRQVARASTGMRQKLGLVTAMSVNASLLILDEPTSSLDPTARREVLSLVQQARDEGRTVLFSSHVLSEVEDVCDRVVVLREGRLVHTQVMSQLRRRHRIQAQLTGPLPELPQELRGAEVHTKDNGIIQFETPDELAPLLGWLATLPLEEVKMEPIGLQAVYDRFHGENNSAVNAPSIPETSNRPQEMAPSATEPTDKTHHSQSHLKPILNRALWARWIADARGLVLGCCFVLFCFQWLAVWITSHFDLIQIPDFLQTFLPGWMQNIMPIPVNAMGSHLGMLAMAYIDPVVLFTITVYAIARGSDSVSGPLDRGTLEMLAAQPIRRSTLFISHACVTVIGAALLACSCWLGTCVGLTLVDLPTEVSAVRFIPAALNLFAFTFFLAALSSLVSSWQRYRRHTISWVGAIFIIQLIVKIISRASEDTQSLKFFTFFGALEPAALACSSGNVVALSLRYNGVYLALGLIAYAMGAWIFCRRDLPAPL